MPGVCVAHLVWAPLGLEPVRRFLRSYRERDAGLDHDLLVVLNGFDDRRALDQVRGELAEVAHEQLVLDEPVQDLAAYRAAVEHAAGSTALCFLNSHTELIADGWLATLDRQLRVAGVGLVGATGSHESIYSDTPLLLKPLRRPQYPPFPNPHLRTNGFMAERATLLALDWRVASSKTSAQMLESGRRGITRQIEGAGAAARVVGRDGVAYAPVDWPRSRTYRSGAQENLLIADNRTRQYAEADASRRAQLARMAWGARAAEAII